VGLIFAILVATDKEEPQFLYPPLDPTTDGIRLLILQPGKRGTIIQCGLVSTTFADNPTYDALSYEWGDGTQCRAIRLNGETVLVRENLGEALDALRDETTDKAVWVDFLCIDQTNTSEKNKQIPLMAFIFRRARQVVIWLGSHEQPLDEQHEQKLGYAKSVDKRAKHAAEIKWEYFLHRLSQEGYWKRAWIIQEVGMASKIIVCYGSGLMEWKDFIESLNWYREHNPNDAAIESILRLDNMRRSKFKQTNSFSLQDLVDEFRDAFCALPHDKVYAFIGLANDTIDNEIPVNYKKSESEVYHDIMRHHFDSLRFEKQKASSVEAVYFAALVRRLLTREKIRQPREIKTFRDTITKNSTSDATTAPPYPSREEAPGNWIKRSDYDDVESFPHTRTSADISEYNGSADMSIYHSIYTTRRSPGRETKDAETEDSEEKNNAKKEASWKNPTLIAIGVVGAAGLVWLFWKLLNPRSSENLEWCWKESSAENLSTWTSTADKEPKEFILRGAIIGKVEHLGPSISGITTSHDAEKRWNAKLGHYFRDSKDLATVRGLNEKLLSILGNTTDFRTRNIISLQPYQPLTSLDELHDKPTGQKGSNESPVLFLGTNMALGVAPANVREGDLICQFWNSNACAVLRKTNPGLRPQYEIVGRAAIVSRDESVDWEVTIDKVRFATSGLFNSNIVDLPVSLMTITRLSLDTVNLPGTTK
jgi:hypothetical protein